MSSRTSNKSQGNSRGTHVNANAATNLVPLQSHVRLYRCNQDGVMLPVMMLFAKGMTDLGLNDVEQARNIYWHVGRQD